MSEELAGTNAAVQNIFRKNLPVTQIFCGDSSNQLHIKDNLFKKGGRKRNIKCECKNGQNGDPAWKKSCNWSFKGELWSVEDVSTVMCIDQPIPGPVTPRPPTIRKFGRNQEKFSDVTIYPNYEVSIDLKLGENQNTWWSNIFGFRVDGLNADPKFPQGSRIPSVFLYEESTRILVCSAVNGNGNKCWASSEEMPVDTWFNLKIKQEAIGSKYIYKIFVDGEEVQSIVNNDPMTFENVNGLIGNAYEPERDYLIPDGHYRNFEFQSQQFGPTPTPVLDGLNGNEIVHSDVTVHPIYSVSIDLNLEQNPHRAWSNVLGFQKDGVIPDHNKGVFPQGSRIPAVFLYPQSTRLYVCSALNDNGNVCWSSKEDMPTDTWFNLKVMQVWNSDTSSVCRPTYTYKILINDVEMKSTENKSPMTFENVDGIIGNTYEPDRNYLTAVGRYRNFEFDSQKTPHPHRPCEENEKRTIETINGIKYKAILFENVKPETNNWAGSKKLCEDYGYQLPVPDSDEMNDFVTNFAPSGVYGEIHLGIEMEASKPNEGYKFNNVYSGEAISYSNWHRQEPNDAKTGKSVVGLIVHNNGWHGKWYDFLTYSGRGGSRAVHNICMKKICDEEPCEKEPEEKRTIKTINGIKYEAILFEKTKPLSKNWAGSKKLCEDNGFQLPVPDSDEMNDFLVDFAPTVYGEIHLGIEMLASAPNEGYKFNNVYSNEAISYSNWHRLEPNDPKTGKSVVGLIVRPGNGWHSKWYDFLTASGRGWRPIHQICIRKI